jgi:fructokinase
MGRLGAVVGFYGALSTDIFGEQLAAGLRASHVHMDYVTRSQEPSTLAFVSLGEGEPEYAFYDEMTSTRLWTRARAPVVQNDIKLVHFGSISLITEPGAGERTQLIHDLASHRLVSFDPNIRPSLIKDEARYRDRMTDIFATAHVIKISAADLDWLYPGRDAAIAARDMLSRNARLVVVTAGSKGAYAWSRGASAFVPVMPVQVADTVGAGDSFMGGLLTWLQEQDAVSIDGLEALDATNLRAALAFSAKVAGITCSREGANPPWRHEIGELAA